MGTLGRICLLSRPEGLADGIALDINRMISIDNTEVGVIDALPGGEYWIILAQHKLDNPLVESQGNAIPDQDAIDAINSALNVFLSLMQVGTRAEYRINALLPLLTINLDDPARYLDFDGMSLDIPSLPTRTEGLPMFEPLDPEITSALGDRLDGLTLLAEALSADAPMTRYFGLIRFFERAFRAGSGKFDREAQLVLSHAPHEFSHKEISRWFENRPRAFHTDRRENVLTAGAVSTFVGRMSEAAYYTFFRKKNWRSRDGETREGWTAHCGTKGSSGGMFLTRGEDVAIQTRLFDPWEAFPLDLRMNLSSSLKDSLISVTNEHSSHHLRWTESAARSSESPSALPDGQGLTLRAELTVLPGESETPTSSE